MKCPCCGKDGLVPLVFPVGKHIELKTGARPISEWGGGCGIGFVSDSRFGSGHVIKRTNRATTRKWRRNTSTTTSNTNSGTGA